MVWRKKKSKFHNILGLWENKEGGIVELSGNLDALGNASEYRVFINDKRLSQQEKSFGNKTDALKYAKKYMREN